MSDTNSEREKDFWEGYFACKAKDMGASDIANSDPCGQVMPNKANKANIDAPTKHFIAGCPYFAIKRDSVKIMEFA